MADPTPEITPAPTRTAELDSILWFKSPANTFRESIPLGNGRLGAMFFGGVNEERVALNESSLWSGSPQDADRHEAHKELPEIQQLLLEGRNDEAEALVMQHFICAGVGSGEGRGAGVPFGCYQVLGNLHLSFHQNNPAEVNATGFPPNRRSHYYRQLDLSTAVMRMEYDLNGVRYCREAIASAPAEAIVIRLTADQPKSIFVRARLDRPERFQTLATGPKALMMTGQLENGLDGQGVKYACRVHAVNRGGEVFTRDHILEMAGCDEVLLLITAATEAQTFGGRNLTNAVAAAADDLNKIKRRTWETLLTEHQLDYQRYYQRVSLKIEAGKDGAGLLSTPERLLALNAGESDPELETLYFNFGRYLLISSSRPGGLPANLQGIWAEEIQTPWNGDWHLNAQQMNYWPAEVCNLSELHLPYLQLVYSLQEPGGRTAQAYYNAGGWVAHMITNPWGFTSPGENAHWGSSALGSGWLCLHLWEHYLFTGDHSHLEWAYPILKGAAQFYLDWLIEEPAHGWLVTAPSSSPENIFLMPDGKRAAICMGPTYDLQIISFLFEACSQAAHLLDLDEDFQQELDEKHARLAPTQIASDGRIMEWLEEYQEALPYHRHTSHLWGLYPGDEITPEDRPELTQAARRTLERRGFVTAGWAIAHRLCEWARLGEGNRAHDLLRQMLAGSTFPNLFNRCYHSPETAEPVEMPDLYDPNHPFQIDGNLGAAAGMAEMLLQSHGGIIRLLPALPDAWKVGQVRGLQARGGFEVDIAWREARLVEARLRPRLDNTCRMAAGMPVSVTCQEQPVMLQPNQNMVEFSALAGEEYLIRPS